MIACCILYNSKYVLSIKTKHLSSGICLHLIEPNWQMGKSSRFQKPVLYVFQIDDSYQVIISCAFLIRSLHDRRFLTEAGRVVETILSLVSISAMLLYKPDIFTLLNIYRGNRFNLRPTVYRSVWLKHLGSSLVTSVYDWNNLSLAIKPDPNQNPSEND